MPLETALHHTPLLDAHIALGAKMVGFGGWSMPLQYEGILAEWAYNRKSCSIFDCSHMGEFIVKGDAVESGLDRIVIQTIADMPPKTCRYGAMLNEAGGVIDDLIVYRKGQGEWMIVVNAANCEKDARHFRAQLSKTARFQDISFQTAKLDVQGPLSRDVLKPLVRGVGELVYYTLDEVELLGHRCLVSRTGYTGELGYEIYCPWEKAEEIWTTILSHPSVKPTGLGARDVLRVEMCYSLYGHELEEHISPLEAGLGKFIDWSKDFIGRGALLKQKAAGPKRTIGYLTSASRKSPRPGHKIYDATGREIGVVTSGTFSPGLQLGIGIGFMDKGVSAAGHRIYFGDDKAKVEAAIAQRPFYKQGSLKT